MEYHSLFGMGPKKRSKEEPVASQELVEIREKKRRLSKWMEGGAEQEKIPETQGPEDQPGESAAIETAEVEQPGKTNHIYMYTLFILCIL